MALIKVEQKGGIAVVILNNPKQLNALSTKMLLELKRTVFRLRKKRAVKGVILMGAGRAFCAGGDLRELKTFTPMKAEAFARLGQETFLAVETFPKTVVVAIHGYAVGGGNELALACDYRVAAQDAKFGQPEVKLGLLPGFGGTVRLQGIIGQKAADRLIRTGKFLTAKQAHAIGLADAVVPEDLLLLKATDYLSRKKRKRAKRNPALFEAERKRFADAFRKKGTRQKIKQALGGTP